MNAPFEIPELRSAHVIVVGNEKGGSGKSTLSIHLVVALLKAGYRVATIDLDTRQQTLTRFFQNRAAWAEKADRSIELPFHHVPGRGASGSVAANEATEFGDFAAAIGAVEHDYEFVLIDTPASDSYLMRLAHSLADTLVSPMNDSFIDFDVLTRVHPDRKARGAVAQYGEIVMEARRQRRLADGGMIDWVVVRNRIASLQTNNARQIQDGLDKLAREFMFRPVEGLRDRVIFRELFPIGLTTLDNIEEGTRAGTLTVSQESARQEIGALLDALQLPIRMPGLEHLEARHVWFSRVSSFYSELANARP